MPRKAKSLTDTAIRCAKPQDKPYTLFDGGGLYLLIMPTGGKSWRLKFRFAGKEHLLSMGQYPTISLLDARQRRDAAKKQIANKINPADIRRAEKLEIIKAQDTFQTVATQWIEGKKKTWNEKHSARVWSSLERDVFPYIGERPVSAIIPAEILSILQRIKTRGSLDTAHRVRNHCSMIFRYAVANQKATSDPAAALIGAIETPKGGHFAAIIDPGKVGELLRAIAGYSGSYPVQCALKLAPMLFVRPGELRHMMWAELDLENARWDIPGEKTKTREPHIVPLSKQALEILESLIPLTGASPYVFPSGRSFNRPMSDNAILAAFRRMGFTKEEMSGHGFRAMARTLLDEVLHEPVDLIEHQLGHTVRDPLGTAYNRTKHLPERTAMMQRWADFLDGLQQGAKVIPFRAKEA